jgi:hypothetical protein
MTNADIKIASVDNKIIQKQATRKLSLAMIVEAKCYPIMNGKISSDTTLYDSDSSISLSLMRKILDLGYKVYPFPVRYHHNILTCRKFRNGVMTFPEYGKEYTKVIGVDSIEGQYYLQFDLSSRTLPFTYEDYFLFNGGVHNFLIWFGDESQSDAPIPYYLFSKSIKISSLLTYEEQITLVANSIESLGFLIDFRLGEKLSVWKYSPFPATAQSPLPLLIDLNLEADILCNLYEDLKVVDFYSRYYSTIENATVEISRILDKYHIRITVFSYNGQVLDSEFFICTASFKSVESTLEKSKLVGCIEYEEFDLSGTYHLKGIRDNSQPTSQDWLSSMEGFEIEFHPDLIVDSGSSDKEVIKMFHSLFNKSLLMSTELDSGVGLTSSFPFNYRDLRDSLVYPGYLQGLKCISELKFAGNLELSVSELEVFSYADDSCNIPNITPYEFNFNQFVTTNRVPLKSALGALRVVNRIQELLQVASTESEARSQFHLIQTEVRDLSFNTLKKVELISLVREIRTFKINIQLISSSILEADYLVAKLVINILR